MSMGKAPVRRWGDDFQLQELLARQPGGLDVVTREPLMPS